MNRQNSAETTSKSMKGLENRPPGGEAMNNKNPIEREVEETLGLLNRQASMAASPGFLAGVRRRIRAAEPARRSPALFFVRRVVVPALLILLVVLNIVAAVSVQSLRRSDSEARQRGYTALAKDYAAYQSDAYANLK
jgi:hypothetical protein